MRHALHTSCASMEAGVRVESENPRTGKRVHACSAYLTFVAQGEDGAPLEREEQDGDAA